MQKILYISYDGLTDPLGQSQIVTYLIRLAKERKIFIISFEKEKPFVQHGERISQLLKESGIVWLRKNYTKKPPIFSTVKDVIGGIKLAEKTIKQEGIDIVHTRGHIAGLIGYTALNSQCKFIFDLRGWLPDEMKESGSWKGFPYTLVYRYFKGKEAQMLRRADKVISLTEHGKDHLVSSFDKREDEIAIVPTCADHERFRLISEAERIQVRNELGISEGAKVMLYSGALGGNYPLENLVNAFKAFSRIHQQTFLLILSKDGIGNLSSEIHSLGLKKGSFTIFHSSFEEIYRYLNSADIGVIFYKSGFSNIGRSPTKLAEYWACGLPFIINEGIGDVDILKRREPSALSIVDYEDKGSLETGLRALTESEAGKLRDLSIKYFSINDGVKAYDNIYNSIVK